MNCRKSEALLMKYLDGNIQNTELERLYSHLAVCWKCNEDFHYYELIKRNVSIEETHTVTKNFEMEVLVKIKELPPCSFSVPKNKRRGEQYLQGILSGLTAIAAVSVTFVIYSQPICAAISENVIFKERNFDYFIYFSSQIQLSVQNISFTLNQYFTDYRLISFFALAAVFVLQFVKNRRRVIHYEK